MSTTTNVPQVKINIMDKATFAGITPSPTELYFITDAGDEIVDYQLPTSQNNYTWYRKYKSGWVEQGGFRNYTTSPLSITLPVEMADTNYTAVATESNSSGGCWAQITDKTTTTVSVGRFYDSGSAGPGGADKDVNWEVKGLAATN